MSSDNIAALGERGVVNQGFAEMLARRALEERDFAVLLGSEEGSTVGGNGEDGEERGKRHLETAGRLGREKHSRRSNGALNHHTGDGSHSAKAESKSERRARAWRRLHGGLGEASCDGREVSRPQTSAVRKVSTFPR